jgi:hypothetical protein
MPLDPRSSSTLVSPFSNRDLLLPNETSLRLNYQVARIMSTAALMPILATIPSVGIRLDHRLEDETRDGLVGHLNVSFRALHRLEESFENTKRTPDCPVKLQRLWQQRTRTKQPDSSHKWQTRHGPGFGAPRTRRPVRRRE